MTNTPTAHGASHASGGNDPIGALGAVTATTLNVSGASTLAAVTATTFGLNKAAVTTQAFPGAVIAAITGGESPTEAEFNSLRASVGAIQAALIAVGILAAS